MSQFNAWVLFEKWLLVAAIYLKRECCRLAEWTGLGVRTPLMVAAVTCVIAAVFTCLRGYGFLSCVAVSMLVAFGLTVAMLNQIVRLRTPGGPETYYAAKREELLVLWKQYASDRARARSEREAAWDQASQEQVNEDSQTGPGGELTEPGVVESQRQSHAQPPALAQQPQQVQQVQQVVVNVVQPRKSAFVAFLLAFFFGPLGMLYSTVGGAIIMLVVSVVLAIFTVGFSLLLTQPICCIWAAVAASHSE